MTTQISAGAEFAQVLNDLGTEALRDGQYEDAGYFFDAADWHEAPSEARQSSRISLLLDAMSGQGTGRA